MASLVRVIAEWDRLTLPSADTAVTTHHFTIPIAPMGQLDVNAHEAAFLAFVDAIRGFMTTDQRLAALKYYDVPAGGGAVTGKPEFATGPHQTGSSAANKLPPQVACSVTEETDLRRRWGRFYLPGMTVSALDPSGAWSNSFVDSIAAAAHDLYEAMAATNRGYATYRRTDGTFQLVSQIRVDNVPDIIRRRRFKTASYRKIHSIAD